MNKLTKDDLQRLLHTSGLTSTELYVVCTQYGFPLPEGTTPPHQMMEVIHERSRQIAAKALRKVRGALRRERHDR